MHCSPFASSSTGIYLTKLNNSHKRNPIRSSKSLGTCCRHSSNPKCVEKRTHSVEVYCSIWRNKPPQEPKSDTNKNTKIFSFYRNLSQIIPKSLRTSFTLNWFLLPSSEGKSCPSEHLPSLSLIWLFWVTTTCETSGNHNLLWVGNYLCQADESNYFKEVAGRCGRSPKEGAGKNTFPLLGWICRHQLNRSNEI